MRSFSACAVTLLAIGASAQATLINFDNFANGTNLTNQYPEAAFSTIAGQVNLIYAFNNGGTSAPNILCTANAGGGVNCAFSTFIDFTNPVNNLTFLAVEPNNSGTVAQINIFTVANAPVSVPLIGLGGNGNKLIDLSAYAQVTRIELTPAPGFTELDQGGGGIGWDNFSFTPVPAPSGLALVGAAGLIAVRRRR